MKNHLRLLLLLSLVSYAIGHDIDESGIQISIQSIRMDTDINLVPVSSPNSETNYVMGSLDGFGIEARYAFHSNLALGGGLYTLIGCSIYEPPIDMSCDITNPIKGAHLQLLAGHNLNSDGIFIYTGVRYYWEWNSQASFGEPVIPIGIGFRFAGVSAEIATDLRDPYNDYSYYNIYQSDDPAWLIGDRFGYGAVSGIPIYLTLGYLF
jgi:hypothetical protein